MQLRGLADEVCEHVLARRESGGPYTAVEGRLRRLGDHAPAVAAQMLGPSRDSHTFMARGA